MHLKEWLGISTQKWIYTFKKKHWKDFIASLELVTSQLETTQVYFRMVGHNNHIVACLPAQGIGGADETQRFKTTSLKHLKTEQMSIIHIKLSKQEGKKGVGWQPSAEESKYASDTVSLKLTLSKSKPNKPSRSINRSYKTLHCI